MIDLKAGRRYAHALMGLAEADNSLPKISSDFVELSKLLAAHPEVHSLIQNPTISLADKLQMVDAIFKNQIDPLLISFVKVLIEKKRFSEIASIQEEFHRQFEKKVGILKVEVITAAPLSQAIAAQLNKTLAAKLKSRVELKTNTDSHMLGGMVLRFEGKEINLSFRTHLEQIHQKMIA